NIKLDTILLGSVKQFKFTTAGVVYNDDFANQDFSINDDISLAFFVDASLQNIFSKKTHVFESNIKVNTINEFTSANGVSIDGLLIKDGRLTTSTIYGNQGLSIYLNTDGTSLNDLAIYDNLTRRYIFDNTGEFSVKKEVGGRFVGLYHEGIANDAEALMIFDFRRATTVNGSSTRLGYFGYGSSSNTNLTIQNDVGPNVFTATYHSFDNYIETSVLKVNTINEKTSANGVYVDNVLLKDGQVYSNTYKSISGMNFDIDTDDNSTSVKWSFRNHSTDEKFYIQDDGAVGIRSEVTGEVLKLVRQNALNPTNANCLVRFAYSTGVGNTENNMGYIGYGSISSPKLTLSNSFGDLDFYSATGFNHIFNNSIKVDSILENSSGNGVYIEGCLLKDSNISVSSRVYFSGTNASSGSVTDCIEFNESNNTYYFMENANHRGATVYAGIGDFSSIKTATITEQTSGGGVNIDGCLIKDGNAESANKLVTTSGTAPVYG
ncbi:MAG: hypothetical protein VKJ09_15710, partial [Leptolyngbya sp.]|nr:hypothetical protein [Leptolyngbya sp.]